MNKSVNIYNDTIKKIKQYGLDYQEVYTSDNDIMITVGDFALWVEIYIHHGTVEYYKKYHDSICMVDTNIDKLLQWYKIAKL